LFCAVAAALVFFFLSFKKNTSAACVLAYKNHDKKVEGNSAKQHRPCILAVLLAVPCGVGLRGFYPNG
jgi:hypothetical protein